MLRREEISLDRSLNNLNKSKRDLLAGNSVAELMSPERGKPDATVRVVRTRIVAKP